MKYIILWNNSEIEFPDLESAQTFLNVKEITSTILSEIERDERILAKKKREHGLYISNECIELLGARNKILQLTSSQITSMLTSLAPIRALLETGALGTARTYLIQLKMAYPQHADIFQDGINDITEFEAEYGL
jgi:hypothetical protein